MPTLGRIPISRHTRRRTARTMKGKIERLQTHALAGGVATDKPPLMVYVPDRAPKQVAVDDRIEVERSWRGPFMWQVVAYREQP